MVPKHVPMEWNALHHWLATCIMVARWWRAAFIMALHLLLGGGGELRRCSSLCLMDFISFGSQSLKKSMSSHRQSQNIKCYPPHPKVSYPSIVRFSLTVDLMSGSPRFGPLVPLGSHGFPSGQTWPESLGFLCLQFGPLES